MEPSTDASTIQYKTEIDLINRILSGEKELYGILIKQNNLKLHRIIHGYIKSRQEVEDVMQNTYIKAYEKLYQFNGNSSFSTWLIRIGINNAIRALKEKEKKVYSYESDELKADQSPSLIADSPDVSPEKMTIRDEIKNDLEKAIEKLPAKYRLVYIMHEIEKISIPEISEITGKSEINIRVRLVRAKSMLKENLKGITLQDVYEFGDKRCDDLVSRVLMEI